MSVEQAYKEFMHKYGTAPKKKRRRRKTLSSVGWRDESERHSLARYGVKSGRKRRVYVSKGGSLRSQQFARGVIGGGVAVAGGTFRFLKKRGEEKKRREEEAKAKRLDEERRIDGEIQRPRERFEERIPFVKSYEAKQRENEYREAQVHARQQKEERQAQLFERRKEMIENG